MTAVALLAELRNRGAIVAVVGDRLRVEAPVGTVTADLREALARHKAELAAALTDPWPCEICGRPATVEAVEPARSGSRLLTFWRCDACPAVGCVPSTLRTPPVWVPVTVQ